jgi:hypothetical protein
MTFEVTEDTLKEIQDHVVFKREFSAYVDSVCGEVRLVPTLSRSRISDAHQFWLEDLRRIESADGLSNGLDHFKQCGLLAYWLRRTSPLTDLQDYSSPVDGDAGHLDSEHEDFRDLLVLSASEYFAFDWPFQMCLFHEKTRENKNERADRVQLSREYIRTMCHFLKRKQVSPHAMFLIYRSLFEV